MPTHVSRLLSPLVLLALLLPAGASAQDFDSAGEQAMLARINAMRASQGQTPLVRHPGLDAAARAHSSDMATQQQLTHVSDSSGTPADRVQAAGVNASSVSENVALHRTANEAHEALIGSDAHRANMLSADATHVGLAALRTPQGVYVTQLYAAVGPAASPQPPPPAPPATPDVAPQMPQPSTERVDEPAPQQAVVAPVPPMQEDEETSDQGPNPNASLSVQPGTNGSVVIAREGGRVVAYWVYANTRWWYYPFPEGAQPGQQLQVDMSVSGPPPGFPEHPNGAPAPQAQQVPPPPPAPRGRRQIVIRRGGVGGRIQVAPGTSFYNVPPPPLVGPPTRAWRRAYRQWERDRRRWQAQQRRMQRQAL